jgi:hypothetical protein
MFAELSSSAAFQFITTEEAALPPATLPADDARGGPTRRPTVVVVRPSPSAGLVRSPLEFKLDFRAFGGAAVDRDSVVLTYLKTPPIDLTQRIMQFMTASGIDVLEAEVPPGLHQFWIEMKDTDGRVGGKEFEFRVAR